MKNGSAKQSLYTYTATVLILWLKLKVKKISIFYLFYLVQARTCKFTTSMISSKVATYGYVASKSPSAMQSALQKYGPLAVAITVVKSIYSYKYALLFNKH